MSDDHRQSVIESAYARLREKLEAKDVSAESLRSAAMEALGRAKDQVELDATWVETELERLQSASAPGSAPETLLRDDPPTTVE